MFIALMFHSIIFISATCEQSQEFFLNFLVDKIFLVDGDFFNENSCCGIGGVGVNVSF
jgi:hypothetical protein